MDSSQQTSVKIAVCVLLVRVTCNCLSPSKMWNKFTEVSFETRFALELFLLRCFVQFYSWIFFVKTTNSCACILKVQRKTGNKGCVIGRIQNLTFFLGILREAENQVWLQNDYFSDPHKKDLIRCKSWCCTNGVDTCWNQSLTQNGPTT